MPKPPTEADNRRYKPRKKATMPQHFGNDDGHDDLAALDFYGADEAGPDDHSGAESDALDFSVPDGSGEESDHDAFDAYAPAQPEDTGTELDAIDAQTHATEEEKDEEDGLQLFTVTNPPETVSVSAAIDGRTQRVDLSPKVTSMSESELRDEILVLADLARQKGLAGQHTYLLDNTELSEAMSEMGFDSNTFLREFLEEGIGIPTPEQADAAQAEVFATRYTTDHD